MWQWDRRQDKWFDAEGVRERLGVPPASIPDLLALVGDTADGFPGLPGWGAKSAAAVLDRWGHLEDIPADPFDVGRGRPRRRQAQRRAPRAVELALLFRRIATVETDAAGRHASTSWRWTRPDRRLRRRVAELGADRLVARAEKLAATRCGRRRLATGLRVLGQVLEGGGLVVVRLLGEAEDALADDVALHLVGAAVDRRALGEQRHAR